MSQALRPHDPTVRAANHDRCAPGPAAVRSIRPRAHRLGVARVVAGRMRLWQFAGVAACTRRPGFKNEVAATPSVPSAPSVVTDESESTFRAAIRSSLPPHVAAKSSWPPPANTREPARRWQDEPGALQFDHIAMNSPFFRAGGDIREPPKNPVPARFSSLPEEQRTPPPPTRRRRRLLA